MSDENDTPTSMADTLRQAMKDSGLTVSAVARAAGIPEQVLHRWKRGVVKQLAAHNLEKLAAFLRLELRPIKRRAK